ncbi:MAG: hypothetical protein MJ210_01440 [Alphaproteobacteria bacterium]|nr:hypothetical protein [Alphaproteobacteria bacterium]
MTKYTTEKKYLIAEDEEGALYFYIQAKNNTPSSPRIIYDGRDHAVFIRSQDENIILDYINPQVRDKLRKAKEVIVVETILENVKDAYVVELEIVEKIPVDWEKIGLTTWEDASLKA